MSNANYIYAGTELNLFAQAIHWKRYVASCMRPFLKGHVLEVGSGQGANIPHLYGQGITSWTAVEPDSSLADKIPTIYNGSPISVVNGTLQNTPAEHQFDVVLYYDVLEHITEDREELTNAVQRMAFGGYLIILSPAHPFLFTEFDLAVGHARRYNKKNLLQTIPACLKQSRLSYLDSAGFFLSLGNKLLLHSSSPGKKQIKFWDRWIIPISRVTDRLSFFCFGKSILGIFKNDMEPK